MSEEIVAAKAGFHVEEQKLDEVSAYVRSVQSTSRGIESLPDRLLIAAPHAAFVDSPHIYALEESQAPFLIAVKQRQQVLVMLPSKIRRLSESRFQNFSGAGVVAQLIEREGELSRGEYCNCVRFPFYVTDQVSEDRAS
ncbi:hypothetical protein [Alienimonas chondri]|uniref:AmmeMemoRadiSam system protein B n=1 Tax=Alienimonas chondri TaxID=2681879 RepID=A0ABX1V9Y3_9PLAN|nr:hypothetical protein [Alienimonas chondri]NNJ24320.1 hypothetical protein [Alienimonas chondri]